MSDPQWYIMKSGERTGPISQGELLSRAQSGLLNREELVWREGFTDWVKAGTIRGLFRSPPPAPTDKPQSPWWQRMFRIQTSPINAETTSIVPAANRKPAKRDSKIDPAANRKMIAQLREDASDTRLVAAEMIRVSVSRNPVNKSIDNFIERIKRISDDTPNPDMAEIVQTAIESVNFANAVSELDKALTFATDIGAKLVYAHATELVKAWPKARQLIRHRWLEDSVKAAEDFREQLRYAVQAHRQDLVEIVENFRQLQELNPRFHSTMPRNDFWQSGVKTTINIAAIIFCKELGENVAAFGTHAWDAWRQKSDDQFVELFGNVLNEFYNKTLAFTEKTKLEVEQVISDFVDDQNHFYQDIIAVLERAIEKTDISNIYHKLHDPDAEQKFDDAGKALLDNVMSNLRDQKISARSEANIKRMLGIS